MPIYEYLCQECGQETELLLTLKEYEGPVHRCDSCNGLLKREIRTPTGITIPDHMKAVAPKSRVPINIIDERADGSYTVHTTAKKLEDRKE